MPQARPLRRGSHLFTLRLWLVETEVQQEWRGKIHDVHAGTVGYFRDWPSLLAWLTKTLNQENAPNGFWLDESKKEAE